jgi:predicted nuclease of restriction endonuclease-like (RecB) superfamily
MPDLIPQPDFTAVVDLIRRSRSEALRAVNTHLIDLYWKIGEYISQRVEIENWGDSVVVNLADFIAKSEPGAKGFSDKNLWRMRQFFEAYRDEPKLSSLVREISWTNNLAILTRCKTVEEKEFYLRLSAKENYSSRELERQISASVFERTLIGNLKLSAVLRELHPAIEGTFRDSYIFEFLNLPEPHSEGDLQQALIAELRSFILELGKDFLFVGEEYRVQVGNSDFFTDLLFYHRGLQCLVMFELKTDKFKPEFLGKLNFYLEALDREVKKESENPSIGVLLCKGKDQTVVEYALARNMSPAMIADYETKLPDKKLLMAKLDEFSRMLESRETD